MRGRSAQAELASQQSSGSQRRSSFHISPDWPTQHNPPQFERQRTLDQMMGDDDDDEAD